jgi:hypothetical protein
VLPELRFHCSFLAGSRAQAPVEFVHDNPDDFVRLANSPGVVLATDRAIEERGVIDGEYQRFRLKLRMSKAMIARWQALGLLTDGAALMMREHGSLWGNKITDVVGRWENLRVEDRTESTGPYKALVADPAFDPAMMAGWMQGEGLEPDSWRGLLARRTISRTSIGFRVELAKMRKLPIEGDMPTYEAPFDIVEASWVWMGQDLKSGMDRGAPKDMELTPEEVAAIARKAAIAAISESREQAAPIPVLAPPKLSDDATWCQLVDLASELLGADSARATEAARAECARDGGSIADAVAHLNAACARALKERTRGTLTAPPPSEPPVPVRHTVTGGDPNAYRALQDLETILIARGMDGAIRRPPPGVECSPKSLSGLRESAIRAAEDVHYQWATVAPEKYLVAFARAKGYLEGDWHGGHGSARVITQILAQKMRAPDDAVIGPMGGRYLAGEGALRDNAGVDVMASMRHGGAGLVPADLPAVYASLVVKIFFNVHDSMMLDIMGLGANVTADDLDEITLIRHDLALGFHEVIGDQPLPQAFMFDDSVKVKTTARGVTLSTGWESMHTNGAQVLTQAPAILAMRWSAAKIRYWIRQLTAGLYKGVSIYTGARDQNTGDLRAWFQSVRDAAAVARPVPLPSDLPATVDPDVPAEGVMRPNALLVPGTLDGVFSDYFAPRQPIQTGQSDSAHTMYEGELRPGMRVTDYLTGRTAYAIVTSGQAATMTTVGLRGQGLQFTSQVDTDIRRLPDMVWRVADTFTAQVTHPESGYRNLVP